MKKMIVYTSGSLYAYQDMYTKHLFEVTESNQLVITSRDKITGEETISACFNRWDYFTLEEE